jgi:NAD(P)-dependent dehydrogenase (short-subunit alcohol dehydrogenase family)
MSVLQAIDAIACKAKLAPATRAVYDRVREIFPTFVDDHPKYKEQRKGKGIVGKLKPPAMKCALVTGGSRGIGRAICLELAAAGYYILVNFRSAEEAAAKTLAMIRAQGGDGELLPFDVGDKGQVHRQLAAWLEKDAERYIEVLVNNAGIKEDALLLWMEDNQWSDVIRTNLDSFFYVTRAVLNGMLLKKYGRIINVVSLAGLKGQAGKPIIRLQSRRHRRH